MITHCAKLHQQNNLEESLPGSLATEPMLTLVFLECVIYQAHKDEMSGCPHTFGPVMYVTRLI